jgi:ribosome biogenesis GTPase
MTADTVRTGLQTSGQQPDGQQTTGTVVSLDRGYPLVRTPEAEVRAQHAIDLVKNVTVRAVVGDIVDLEFEAGQDTPYISHIHDRSSILVRRQVVESIHEGSGKSAEQILAANFDVVYIVQSLGKRQLDLDYLERQLVMAHQSGVEVAVLLTKLDVAKHADLDIAAAVDCAIGARVLAVSLLDDTEPLLLTDSAGVPADKKLASSCGTRPQAASNKSSDTLVDFLSAAPESPDNNSGSVSMVGVLLGRSGVGKSTLVNRLLGEDRLETGSVRKKDSAGRHTTVARKLVYLPGGGALIDTPGLRSIGVYGAEHGLATTFAEITSAASNCRYRDCTHAHEPGCAVIEAVRSGQIPERRLISYRTLSSEVFD